MFRPNSLTEREFKLGRRERHNTAVIGFSPGFRMFWVRHDGGQYQYFKSLVAARAAATRREVYA